MFGDFVGSDFGTMGMELQNHKIESLEMGIISDSELVYHVKETLRAVPLVSILAWCLSIFAMKVAF